MKKLLALLLMLALAVSAFTACEPAKSSEQSDSSSEESSSGGDSPVVPQYEPKKGTYRSFTSVMPSNWNELTYEDANDTQILDYLTSPFFEYDYKFDEEKGGKFNEDGSINADAIVSGGFDVKYSAATAAEDVTSVVDQKWGYTGDQKEAGGYAWKFTLRKDIKWNDGTPINAHDFVYTMQQMLDPAFLNMRANSYYSITPLKNASKYVFSLDDTVHVPVTQLGYASIAEAVEAGADVEINLGEFFNANGALKVTSYDPQMCEIAFDYEHPFANDWADVSDEQMYFDIAPFAGDMPQYIKEDNTVDTEAIKNDRVDLSDYLFSAKGVCDGYLPYLEVGGPYESEIAIRIANENKDFPFEGVGIYAPSDYELVVCMESPLKLFKEDGSLSYLAAYNFASLPLVKKDLYEACKREPVEGATLWTSVYNSSLDTTASWGPYMLTAFQSGKSYTLSRNDNWYGYGLEDNRNQYNVTKIVCEKIEKVETQWMGFLNGTLDDVGLDVGHKDDYRNSKYTKYAPGSGTFGINLQANLDALKSGDRNNGILAIRDFRKGISLGLNRDEYNTTCYTSHKTCFGIMGPSYYYDVENGGVYRHTEYAMKALLRVYGFSENEDGTWNAGEKVFADYEEAYDAMTGYDPVQAKEYVTRAYRELTSDPEKYGYNPDKPIVLKYGTSSDTENTQRNYNYVKKMLLDLFKDTPLEGKVEIPFDASFGAKWADAFKDGEYDIAAGTGYQGGPFDPFGFLGCYVDPYLGLMFATWWHPEKEMLTYTMPEGDYDDAGKEYTMSIFNWYCCLNGTAEVQQVPQTYTYNWGKDFIPAEARLQLLAKLEEITLEQYYSVSTTSQFSASLLGAKFSYISDEHNIFMGFGGNRYLIVNYDDDEWNNYVAERDNNLEAEYKKEQ